MITFTKEQLIASAHARIEFAEMMLAGELEPLKERTWSIELELARIALASLEAEAVAWTDADELRDVKNGGSGYLFAIGGEANKFAEPHRQVMLYTATPAPVSVPKDIPDSVYEILCQACGGGEKACDFADELWNACRAAMLQGADGNSPVIPDDVRRMDWLVSKTVDVREPMVYGSHSLFWSQTITDEEDDYHATKLREQIDAAMAAEQAAAPQQEVK